MFGSDLLGELLNKKGTSTLYYLSQRNRLLAEFRDDAFIEKALLPKNFKQESMDMFEYLNTVRMEADKQVRCKETLMLIVNYLIDKNMQNQIISTECLMEIIFLLVINP